MQNFPFLQKKPGDRDILFFTRHLAIMLKVGVPVTQALSTLASQPDARLFTRVKLQIIKDIENGLSFSKACSRYPDIFSSLYIHLLEISEETGKLDENLAFLARQLEKNYQLKKKIQAALLYPGLILFTVIVMSSFLIIFVLPKLVDFFDSFNVALPLATRILLFIAQVSKTYGLFIIPFLFIIVLLIKFSGVNSSAKKFWHNLLLKIPVLSTFIRQAELAQFGRNFGTLIKAGVSIVKSIEITAQSMPNVIYRKKLMQLSQMVQKGNTVAQSLEHISKKLFPSFVTDMIKVGETSGKLDETLLYIGDFFDEEVDTFSKNLTTILEPLLLIGMGILVGFVALAIISPIYQLTGSISP